MEYTLHGYYTLIAAVLVLLLGRFMVLKIDLLRRYNIPEPVVGGLVAAALAYVLHAAFGLSAKFSQDLQTTFMLIFFTSIGLGANIAKLFAGGRSLVIFLLCIVGFILVQNTVGMGLAKMLGLDPLIGLVAGSISLTGGHGTAGAWGEILENKYVVEQKKF